MAQQNPLNELYDIYGMWHVPWWQSRTFYAVLIIIALALLGLLIWFALKRYAEYKSRLTPWERAQRDLAQISERYAGAQHSKEFYYALTAILKRYMHERYGFAVYDKTDSELVAYLATVDFPVELLEPLRSMLQSGITIKFAQGLAEQHQMNEDRAMACTIIEKTIPLSK